MSGKLYIAAAGAGKTRKIVDESINSNKKVLILQMKDKLLIELKSVKE